MSGSKAQVYDPRRTDMEHADTDVLLARAGQGDAAAREQLLTRHRDRLRRMVAVRLDRRLAARVDASDVVQDTLTDAAGKLAEYARDRPLPFYPWLRRLAWERVVKLHQRHITAGKRSVTREEAPPLPEESALELAQRLAAPGPSPSKQVLRRELQGRVSAALATLAPHDREVLVLRYLEQLPIADVAAILGVSVGAVKSRQLRALVRLRALLADDLAESQ
jgi:RNA polymerase sigma-70 factor (ECF subfamily)